MPVPAYAEEDEVEAGDSPGFEMGHQVMLIYSGSLCWSKFSLYPVDVVARYVDPGEQFFIGKPEVALLMVRRHTPFVSPEDMNVFPGNLPAVGSAEQVIELLRSRTA